MADEWPLTWQLDESGISEDVKALMKDKKIIGVALEDSPLIGENMQKNKERIIKIQMNLDTINGENEI